MSKSVGCLTIVDSSSGTPACNSMLSAPASTHLGSKVSSSLALCLYLMAFAAGGQAASQFPQPIHKSGIITRFFGIASVGQVGMHRLQETQLSVIKAFLT